MSATLKLISYDLGGPETSESYKKIRDYMYTYGTRCKPLESFWLLKTPKNCESLRDEIKQAAGLDSNDKLIVFEWNMDDWATIGLPKKVTDWLRARDQED